MKPFEDLARSLRDYADFYERDNALVNGATLCRRIADQVESACREWQWETLTITEAAEETGRAYTTIWRKVKKGTLGNVGTEEHPRIRRVDLYRDGRAAAGPDIAGRVLRDSTAATCPSR